MTYGIWDLQLISCASAAENGWVGGLMDNEAVFASPTVTGVFQSENKAKTWISKTYLQQVFCSIYCHAWWSFYNVGSLEKLWTPTVLYVVTGVMEGIFQADKQQARGDH